MVRVDRQRLLAADLRLKVAFGPQMAKTFRAKPGRTEFGRRKAWASRGRRGGSPAFATIHLHFPRPSQVNL